MKRLSWYVCCWMQSLLWITAAQASPTQEATDRSTNNIPTTVQLDNSPAIAAPSLPLTQVSQPAPSTPLTLGLTNQPESFYQNEDRAPTSPGFSIFNPVGFGADNNTLFFSLSYQKRTRFTRTSDGEAGFGIGLGDGFRSVGAELTYGINSFGSSSGFGSGAFSIKLHKRLSEDTSVAVGWNQFLQIRFAGGSSSAASDYPRNSYYAVGTKIFRTRENVEDVFSRVAVTGGIGSGVFLRFDRTLNPGDSNGGLNAFGSIGVRVTRPVSAILEWTGQDLAAGLSIAPFENFPLVVTPAFRDLAGAGDGARFVLGTSVFVNF